MHPGGFTVRCHRSALCSASPAPHPTSQGLAANSAPVSVQWLSTWRSSLSPVLAHVLLRHIQPAPWTRASLPSPCCAAVCHTLHFMMAMVGIGRYALPHLRPVIHSCIAHCRYTRLIHLCYHVATLRCSSPFLADSPSGVVELEASAAGSAPTASSSALQARGLGRG